MRGGRRTIGLLAAALLVLVGDLAVLVDHGQQEWRETAIAATAASAATPAVTDRRSVAIGPDQLMVDVIPTTTTTAPPPTTTTAPPAPTPPAASAAPVAARSDAWTYGPYEGLGVWLDVYDWTMEFTKGHPRIGLEHVDQMADLGIQTIFIQTGHRRSASDVIEIDRLLPIIDRAHSRGMAVVAWYLPMLEDLGLDVRRLVAAGALPVDGLGVDIESLAVRDPGERTARLLELSSALRSIVGDRAISAITPDAVHLQVVNPSFWPGFPWFQLSNLYDVIVPMAYWSIRRPEWKEGERYINENIDRIRAATGRPVPIHVAGGIADGVSGDDLNGMVRAILSRDVLGGSLYDWNTSHPGQWGLLHALRLDQRR